MPVVASARRLKDPVLVLQPPEDMASSPVVWKTLEDISDYHQPLAPGALFKCAVIVYLSNRSHQPRLFTGTGPTAQFQRGRWYRGSHEVFTSTGFRFGYFFCTVGSPACGRM